jgi:hypothetical protein
MKKNLFAIRDGKAGYFMQPFCAVSAGYAERAFVDACIDVNTMLSKHPEDYTLFSIGTFDEISGEVSSDVKSLINGLQAVNSGLRIVAEEEKEVA